MVDKDYRELGPVSFEEKCILTVFFIAAFLWVFRKRLDIGAISIPGWSQILPYPDLIDDGTVAICMAILLFIIPVKNRDRGTSTIINADIFKDIPWNIVLLFGGGFALAKGFQVSGLSSLIGDKFAGLEGFSPYLMVNITCGTLTFLTELTSNTATTEMILPVLASVAVAMKINPLLLMIPATLSASCAFMMPVATPPNAIIFGSGRIRIIEMVKAGLLINIIGILLISLLSYTLVAFMFSIDTSSFPEWANIYNSVVN